MGLFALGSGQWFKERKMKLDRTTKLLLVLIALGLWANALSPLFRPARIVHASATWKCDGKLKASAFGAKEFPGGYDVDVTCRE